MISAMPAAATAPAAAPATPIAAGPEAGPAAAVVAMAADVGGVLHQARIPSGRLDGRRRSDRHRIGALRRERDSRHERGRGGQREKEWTHDDPPWVVCSMKRQNSVIRTAL